MSAPQKLLILGGCGFIGRHMFERLGPDRAIGTYFANTLEGGVYFNALKQDLAEIAAPGGIWHCMILYADSHPDSCARDPEASNALNVESTKRVIARLFEWGVPLTFASSEFVFDGTGHEADEGTPPNPIMLYGQQKLAVEAHLQARYPNEPWTVFRFGKVFGSSRQNEKLFTGWIEALEKGATICIANDQTFSPIHVDDVVTACLKAAEDEVRGLYHLCGTKAYGRHELLEMTIESVRRYRDIEPHIETCSIDDFELPARRPKDVSMRPDKIIGITGLPIMPTRRICDMIVDRHFQDRGGVHGD